MKRFLLALAFLGFIVSGLPTPADAACAGGTCYWRAALTKNWSDASGTGPWATSSGGAACSCAPASSADSVVFDTNSNGSVATIDSTLTIGSFDATGYTGTLTQSATLTVAGNTFKLASGMTFTATNRLTTFTPASGNTVTVTSAGKSFGALTLTGADGTAQLKLADALTLLNNSNGNLTINAGIFDAATNNVAVTFYAFASPNGSSRTINMGSNTWTVTGDDTAITAFSVGSTATLNAGTSTLLFNKATPVTTVSLDLGTLSLNIVTLNAGSAFPSNLSSNGGTIKTLNVGSPTKTVTFSNSKTYTITDALNITGSLSNPILFQSNVSFASSTLAITSGSITDWVGFRGITLTGSGTKLVGTNCLDYGQNNFNSGTCTAPVMGGGGRIIGG